MLSRRFVLAGVSAGLAASSLAASSLATPAIAQARTAVRMTLGWKTQGSDAPFLLARDKGYFSEAGIDIQIDQGEGSGATVTRIMSGAYDVGFGDINAIIQNAATRPADTPVMVYQLWNQPPFAIVTRANSGIQTIRDFEGRTLGGAPGTPTTRLLPVFARVNNLDLAKIRLTSMAPNLQEPMLIQGQIDAALVFNITSYFNLVLNRQDPDRDFRWFAFGDHGLDLYSNGFMVSQRLIRDNPRAVGAMVRAVNRANLETGANQTTAMAAVQAFDPLINGAVEKRRLQYAFDRLIMSPELNEIGAGDVKDDRLARAIGMVVSGYELPRTPAPSEIFSRAFLPPRAERSMVYRVS